jgi:hypothetical protein
VGVVRRGRGKEETRRGLTLRGFEPPLLYLKGRKKGRKEGRKEGGTSRMEGYQGRGEGRKQGDIN